MKKSLKKLTSLFVSGAILSALLCSSPVSASTAVNDPTVSAHCIYSRPDLSQTSGSFLSFMIDFRTDNQAIGTYWQLCQATLDVTELKAQYPTVSNAVFYGGFQRSVNKINTLFSFWDIVEDYNENKVITTPTRVYPAGDEHLFGGEGNGHNYFMDYEWKENTWYTLLVHCWKDKATGKTFIGQWIRNTEDGEWILTSYFNTTLSETCIQGSMSQFMESFSKPYWGLKRDIYLKNIYTYDKIKKQWFSLDKMSMNYSYMYPDKNGTHTLKITDEYFFGDAGEKVENQALYDSQNPQILTGTVKQPAVPNFGNFSINTMSVDNEKLEWDFSESSAPALSFSADIINKDTMEVTSYVCTRPEVRELSLKELSDGNYLIHTQFTDVFDRSCSCDYAVTVRNGATTGNSSAVLLGDFDQDCAVTIKDAVGILRETVGIASADNFQKWLGDVSKDGRISVKDAVILQRWLIDEETPYTVGRSADIVSSVTPVILPQIQESPTQPSTQPPVSHTVRFTDNKNWGNIFIYAWNETTQLSNAKWPGVAMFYESVNSYGQKVYKADISSEYTHIIFTTADGFLQTQDILLDNSVNGYYVTDGTMTNSFGKTVYIAQSW